MNNVSLTLWKLPQTMSVGSRGWESNCDEAEGAGKWFSINACENIEINDRDDVNDNGPVEPYLTHCEVLKAVSTIGK
jgi:hypothetical protein